MKYVMKNIDSFDESFEGTLEELSNAVNKSHRELERFRINSRDKTKKPLKKPKEFKVVIPDGFTFSEEIFPFLSRLLINYDKFLSIKDKRFALLYKKSHEYLSDLESALNGNSKNLSLALGMRDGIFNYGNDSMWDWLPISKESSQLFWACINRSLSELTINSSDSNHENIVKYLISEIVANIEEHAIKAGEPILTEFGIALKDDNLSLMVADAGYSISQSVHDLKPHLSDCECIEWARTPNNSTKVSNGGMGIPTIVDNINKLNGKMKIISNNGIMVLENGKEMYSNRGLSILGTIIILRLPLKDLLSSNLKFETDESIKGVFHD